MAGVLPGQCRDSADLELQEGCQSSLHLLLEVSKRSGTLQSRGRWGHFACRGRLLLTAPRVQHSFAKSCSQGLGCVLTSLSRTWPAACCPQPGGRGQVKSYCKKSLEIAICCNMRGFMLLSPGAYQRQETHFDAHVAIQIPLTPYGRRRSMDCLFPLVEALYYQPSQRQHFIPLSTPWA